MLHSVGKLAEAFVLNVSSADLPVNTCYRFLGPLNSCFGGDFFSFYFFYLSCYQMSSHLLSSDWNPKFPTLGHNELILCMCCLAYVLIGFSSQIGKTIDLEV